MTLYSALSRAAMIYSANIIKVNLEILGEISCAVRTVLHPPPGPNCHSRLWLATMTAPKPLIGRPGKTAASEPVLVGGGAPRPAPGVQCRHAGTSEPRGYRAAGFGRGNGGMRPVGPRGRGEAELQAPSVKVIADLKDDFMAKCKALQFSVRFTIYSTSSKYPGWRISSSLHNTPHIYEPLFSNRNIDECVRPTVRACKMSQVCSRSREGLRP
jgi:hypothetical protein